MTNTFMQMNFENWLSPLWGGLGSGVACSRVAASVWLNAISREEGQVSWVHERSFRNKPEL